MARASRSRRSQAAAVLDRCGAVALLGAVRRMARGNLTILAYHRVLDVPDEDTFEFDVELVSATVADFNQQIEHLKRHFHPMTFREVLEFVDENSPLPPGACVVTFDDGFADNYLNAFPILKRWGVPATIFVSTGNLDSQETFWFDHLAHAVLTTSARTICRPGAADISVGHTAAERRATIKSLLRDLKRVPDSRRRDDLQALLDQLLPETRVVSAQSAPMTWEMVLEMSAWGIEFGSHTVSHPVLSTLAPERLKAELRDSKARIEQMLGKPVEVIAYPVGGADAFSELVQSEVRAAGYRLGLSYIPGVENVKSWDPFAIRRLHVERYVDPAWFRAMLNAPGLFA